MLDPSANSCIDPKVNVDAAAKIRHLWDALNFAHAKLNSVARYDAGKVLTLVQKQNLRQVFADTHDLLLDDSLIVELQAYDDNALLTTGDALILVGQQRTKVRDFRVRVLGEDPFKLRL